MHWTVNKNPLRTLKIGTDRKPRQTLIGDPTKMTGLRSIVGGGRFFNVLYDWNETHGFHMNAMRGNQVKHFAAINQTEEFDTELQAVRRYDTLTDKISRLDDAEATNWFMSDMLVWESDSVVT
jgi:hypothetical protein